MKMIDLGRFAERSRSDCVKMFDQGWFAEGSTTDRAKMFDQGWFAEWLAGYLPKEQG